MNIILPHGPLRGQNQGQAPPLFSPRTVTNKPEDEPEVPPAPDQDWGWLRSHCAAMASDSGRMEGGGPLGLLMEYFSVPRPEEQAAYLINNLAQVPAESWLDLGLLAQPVSLVKPPGFRNTPRSHPLFASGAWFGPSAADDTGTELSEKIMRWAWLKWLTPLALEFNLHLGNPDVALEFDLFGSSRAEALDHSIAIQAGELRKKLFGDPPSQDLFKKHKAVASLLVLLSSGRFQYVDYLSQADGLRNALPLMHPCDLPALPQAPFWAERHEVIKHACVRAWKRALGW